jgi:acetyl-CoA carboxylase carboxyltransferase component
MKFRQQISEYAARAASARAMGGPEKLARRRQDGVLNVRERIERLLDPGTFRESGLFGVSFIPEMRDSTPCDGKVTGFGKVDGRRVGVVGYDFTVKGSPPATPTTARWRTSRIPGAGADFPWCSSVNPPGCACPTSWVKAWA